MSLKSDAERDTIRTVIEPSYASVLVLGSKFLATLAPAAGSDVAERVHHDRVRRYPDASHHCWAYRCGRPLALLERSSDAGEPSGTAGRPILDTLRSVSLENVTCVVSRYFGGTKLGTGGLARAYADATQEVCRTATFVEQTIVRVVFLDFDHDRTGIVYRALEEFGTRFVGETFDTRAHGRIEVPQSRVARLRERLLELSHTGIDWHEGELKLT